MENMIFHKKKIGCDVLLNKNMKLKIIIYLSLIFIIIVIGCSNQTNTPKSGVIKRIEISDQKNPPTPIDSTIEVIDSCTNKYYKAKLEEYINLDSNAFKLTVTQNGVNKYYNLDLRPGLTNIKDCKRQYIVLISTCGGPCSGDEFIFMQEKRPNEGYLFCHIAENNDNIITYHENEEFEIIYIRNLSNGKVIKEDISPCENTISYPCGISKIKIKNRNLIITFDAQEDEQPRIKKIDISTIL